jgi:hypothetical protein
MKISKKKKNATTLFNENVDLGRGEMFLKLKEFK